MICIPQIMWSGFLFASYVTFSSKSPCYNLAWLGLLAFGTYYIALDRQAGLLTAPILLAVGLLTNYIHENYPATSDVFKVTLPIHISSWLAQFYGHYHDEHRSPAVLDNLVQPIVLAPYFVVFEFIFLAGYRRDLEKRILRRAKLLLDEARKAGKIR